MGFKSNDMARVSRVKRNIVGVNWHLRYRLKIEDLEHKLDDMRLYVRQLERKLKKLTSSSLENPSTYCDKPSQKL